MSPGLRRRLGELALVVAMVGVAAVVGGYILAHQRITWPAWLPGLGERSFTIKAQFVTAQAVAPGQGQTVTVAGVRVGEIARVDLEGGRAVVTMRLDPAWNGRVRSNATLLLRPKTGLKDMTIAMTPGDQRAPALPGGATLSIANTQPDVNLDEVLGSLDADTRSYLQLLLNGAGSALRDNGRELSAALRRLDPTARDLARINDGLDKRHTLIRHAVGDFRALAQAVGGKDRELAQLVDASNAVLGAFAASEPQVREALRLLPGALRATRAGLTATGSFADALGQASRALQPTAAALAPGLKATTPFLRQTAPLIENDLRPFARDAKPVLDALRPAAGDLVPTTNDLGGVFSVFNEFLNELAFQPSGGSRESFLFYLAWLNHDLNATYNVQDAHGVRQRGVVLTSCSSRTILDGAAKANASVRLLIDLLGPPSTAQLCTGAAR